ncbi:hypothetical protein [Vineibacter terrae]|uniref:hypothetical protein n=1 Tax=Vineibacter terrae TaxID=2586908 RepID=UPI002E306C4A|nr:hypothetical protein [Vineibacter terrae]HEX2891338.1 hypothetical protein [Vineibacter terrae]
MSSIVFRAVPLAMLGVLAVAGFSSAASAQGLNTGAYGTRTPYVDAREHYQQDRIFAGARNGSLTPREFRRLEGGEYRIRAAEARAKSDGVVTPAERARLNGMLDRESRAIYRQRHDAQRVGWWR